MMKIISIMELYQWCFAAILYIKHRYEVAAKYHRYVYFSRQCQHNCWFLAKKKDTLEDRSHAEDNYYKMASD